MLMTNGIGATLGTLSAQAIVNHITTEEAIVIDGVTRFFRVGDWSTCWYIFAAYALVVAILFMICFKDTRKQSAK